MKNRQGLCQTKTKMFVHCEGKKPTERIDNLHGGRKHQPIEHLVIM